MKKKIFAALVIVSLLVFLMPGTAQAGSGLVVSSSSVMMNFPTSITIGISAESDVNVTDIRLHYTVEHQAFAQVIAEAFIAFTPAKTVNRRMASPPLRVTRISAWGHVSASTSARMRSATWPAS